MRSVTFASVVMMMSVGVLAGCDPGPEPESGCFRDGECAASTPVCGRYSGVCTHACTASDECGDLAVQTSCDSFEGVCAPPCTADSIGFYACVGGERVYCDDDPTLSCAVCPSVCGSDAFCDGAACQPRRAAGEACTTDAECSSSACTEAGRCSVEQGEACTDETCQGVCAERPSGETMCIRDYCPSDCAERTDGGLEWYCARYETYQACVPLVSCSWESPCSTFVDATCGMSCRTDGGGCWTYCVPNVISTDD